MGSSSSTNKVFNLIIVLVFVFVMDVESVFHRPVEMPPYIYVKAFPLSLICRLRRQIIARLPIKSELVPIKNAVFLSSL